MSIRPRKRVETKITEAQAFDLILRPIITEKSTMLSEQNQIGFVVPIDASKPEIKAAVEMLYKVEVKAVNTLILKGKTKRFRGVLGRRKDEKKAIITLAEGQNIDLMQGV